MLILFRGFQMIGFLLAFYACGNPQNYQLSPLATKVEGPGEYLIPAQVDFFFALDDSPSMMNQVGSDIANIIRGFLIQLDQKKWDYHLILAPLTNPQWTLRQVVGSHHDPTHPQWQPLYPGVTREEVLTLPHLKDSFFKTAQAYQIDFAASSKTPEKGFEVILKNLNSPELKTSGFLRESALFVLVVLSNGNDVSGLTRRRTRLDDKLEWDPSESTQSLKHFFQQLKGAYPGLSFVSMVAHREGVCKIGKKTSYAIRGARYIEMASLLEGYSYDLCSQSLEALFGQLATVLAGQRASMEQRHVLVEFLNPDPSRLKVQIQRSGTNQKEDLPRCPTVFSAAFSAPTPCWTYQALKPHETVFLIEKPRPLNPLSGKNVLELSPPAWLKGQDQIFIEEFDPNQK